MCQTVKDQCDTIRKDMAIFWQQSGTRVSDAPSEVMGYVLKENYFNPAVPRFLGIPLAKTISGYNFAVYVPADSGTATAALAS